MAYAILCQGHGSIVLVHTTLTYTNHTTCVVTNSGFRIADSPLYGYSPPFSAAVMEEYSYSSTHPLGHNQACNGITLLYGYSPPFSAAVMEEYSYSSNHPLGHNQACNRITLLYGYIYRFLLRLQQSDGWHCCQERTIIWRDWYQKVRFCQVNYLSSSPFTVIFII